MDGTFKLHLYLDIIYIKFFDKETFQTFKNTYLLHGKT